MFAHLHCHSNYSFLRGACTVDELASAAKARGMRALAITDTNGLYGAIPFYKACREHSIKPIFGAQIVCRSDTGSGAHDSAGAAESAVVLAKNRRGFSELCRIITARHLDEHFDLFNAIREASDDVVVIVSDTGLMQRLNDYGHGAKVYFELKPAENARQAKLRDELGRWAKKRLIPVVAANNVHFVNPHQRRIHQVLRAIDANTSIESLPPDEFAGSECWLKPPERVKQELGEWEIAAANASEIAIECNVDLELGKLRFPTFPLAPNESAAGYLRKVTYEAARLKYGTLADVVRPRVDYELDVIIQMGYADYFLIVWDIVEEAKRRGVPTVGRGSAADSIVSYVLDMTKVDPIEHNLYFERFLNPERKDPPDIDLDFCWRRRDEVLAYVFEKYGQDRVAMIGTHNTFGARSAIREIARAIGLSPAEITRIAHKLPYGSVENIENAVANIPEYADLPIHKEPLKSIIDIARSIDGFPRHMSVHAGGLVIAPDVLTEFVPLQYAAKGVIITQYDMHPIEDMGLVKMDLLGQRSLSVIADTVSAVRQHHGIEIDVEHIPLDDEPTRRLLRSGSTIGCFQIESPGMRQLLQKLHADNLPILIAASSLIRPGPADSGMMASFIRRYRGKEPVSYLHPKLESVLSETFGIMLYQEDILKVANAIGGLSLGEADNLRRSMSKKRGYEGIAKEKDRFLQGAAKNGIPEDAAQEIWHGIESFSGYAFCKAHSASYAQLSWQAAYLKAHYPAEFMAGVLANHGGFYGAWVYVEEARRIGAKILPPDVNRSEAEFTATDGAIRVGLNSVKSLTARGIRTIIAERPFASLHDFLTRVPLSLKECENLAQCGAMDAFGANRPQILWRLQMLYPLTRQLQKTRAPAGKLFEIEEEEPPVPDIPDYPLADKLEFERKVLDFCVTVHPMTLHARLYETGRLVPIAHAARYTGRQIRVGGIPITVKGTITSRNERMKFLSLEDHTGIIEVVLFPDAYRRYGRLLGQGMLAVRGRVSEDEGSITLEAETVEEI